MRSNPFDVLMQKLAPLLETLTPQEIEAIPLAAEALARRPGGARSVLYPRPAQPIEVVYPRVNGEVVGALLLRRKWVEQAVAGYWDDEAQRGSHWPRILSQVSDELLMVLPGDLARWLSRQAEFISEHGWLLHEHDSESVLDLLEVSTPEDVRKWLCVPFILATLVWAARRGRPEEKRRVKKIFKSCSPTGHGAPTKPSETRKDVRIARQVDEARDDLAPGKQLLRKHLSAPTYKTTRSNVESELNALGYQKDQINALLKTGRKGEPAYRYVADRNRMKVASVRATASRGRKLLRSGRS